MVEEDIAPGDCVIIPDGRVARVRENRDGLYRVRVRRKTSKTHQFLDFPRRDLIKTPCPKGWMSPEGYNRYLQATLEKMRQRQSRK
jgi:3-hydroxy-3-methylglutaryl CoA synthase